MDQVGRRAQHILVAERSNERREEALTALENFFPAAEVRAADSWETSESTLKKDEFDIVVLDLDLVGDRPLLDLIFRLKTFDYEPSVIVLADKPPAHILNELYKFGCHRCIVKDERWIEELGTAVDYLMRIRKVSHENHILRAKLTEANMLLEEKNARLDEFSTTVAHDIRGPLGGLAMKLEYILEHGEGVDPARVETLLRNALGSTERLIDLVQSMYDFAKLGTKASSMDHLSLEDLISEVVEDLNFPDELDIEIGLGELPTVWGNKELLRRVFLNLLSNAVKYNDKEKIQINIQVESIIKRMVAPYVEISVSDNGPGIPKDEQAEIFSLFKRGAVGRNKAGDGAGVGLAVVKRIIELHFGEVRLESQPGSHTKFLFSLPLESPTALI